MQSTQREVTKAVFPVAGLGTRFLPATKANPKEMLCVVDKPLIQYAVEEAAAAGITEMIFVTGRNKHAIEDHFDKAFELEADLAAKQKHHLLEALRSIKPKGIECFYVRQAETLGLGHAVLCAERLVHSQPFAVLLADDLVDAVKPAMQQMTELFAQQGNSILAVERVEPELSAMYGMVACEPIGGNLRQLTGIIEKPTPEIAPSNLGVIGRYIFTPSIFTYLRAIVPGAGGELQLTDAVAAMLRDELVMAYEFSGTRYDCGSKAGYLKATIDFALQHAEVKETFSKFLLARASQILLPTAA